MNGQRKIIFYADVDTDRQLDPAQRAYPYLQVSRVSGDPGVVTLATRAEGDLARANFVSLRNKGYELKFASDADLFSMGLENLARCLEADEQQAIRKLWDNCAVPHPNLVLHK